MRSTHNATEGRSGHISTQVIPEHVRDTIQALMRSGAGDSPECEPVAVQALAEFAEISTHEAERYWIIYTAPTTLN